MQKQEAIYELSMIRDRLEDFDKVLSQQKSTVGIDGKPIDERACLQLAACVGKAIAVADAIAAKNTGQKRT